MTRILLFFALSATGVACLSHIQSYLNGSKWRNFYQCFILINSSYNSYNTAVDVSTLCMVAVRIPVKY